MLQLVFHSIGYFAITNNVIAPTTASRLCTSMIDSIYHPLVFIDKKNGNFEFILRFNKK
ncbi:MAG: hypothetical protein H7211_02685 [Aquabacterium sp.]|nr:hypothetical protein [Ferruginibacter sp.]